MIKEVLNMTFGEKLFQLRRERGMSQEALAQELNVSRQAVSRWELGEVAPDTGNVLAASRLFGVSTDYLLRDEYSREEDIPVVKRAEASLRQRERRVGAAFLLRIFWLTPVVLYHQGRLLPDRMLPTPYLLALQVLFSALLFRQIWRYAEQEGGDQKKLLIPDLLAAASVFVLPYVLSGIGTLSILVALLVACPCLVRSVKVLRLHYGLPWKGLNQ